MLKINQPVTNPDLKEYMKAAREEKTPESLGRVYEEIAMKAEFLNVVNIDGEIEKNEEGEDVVTKNRKMQFPLLQAPTGAMYFPAFTDMEEIQKWEIFKDEKPTTVVMRFDDYFAMMRNNKTAAGVVVNPFSDNVILNRENLENLRAKREEVLNGIQQHRFKEGEQVMIGDPQEFPVMMAEDMREYFRKLENVHRAWLRIMVQNEEPGFLVVIDADVENDRGMNEIFKGLADAVRDRLDDMTKLNMVAYTERFGLSAAQDCEPFYDREDDLVLQKNAQEEAVGKKEEAAFEEQDDVAGSDTISEEDTNKKKFRFFRKKK